MARPNLCSETRSIIASFAPGTPIKTIADSVKCSKESVYKYRRIQGQEFSSPERYPKATIEDVLACYKDNPLSVVADEFPGVNVRSVVKRHGRGRKRIAWTSRDIHNAVKMAGFKDFKEQSKILGRPSANAGSIRALWSKRFKMGTQEIHGMNLTSAMCLSEGPIRHVVLPPQISEGRGKGRHSQKVRRIVLWVDLETNLRSLVPDSLKVGIKTLAQFQRWLFFPETPLGAIAAMGVKFEWLAKSVS